jgi:endonuclease I
VKIGGGTGPYNREHTWPNSYGFPNDGGTSYPYTDCHHLFLCDVAYNADRGNRPYGNCALGATERVTDFNDGQGGGAGVFPGNSNWFQGSVWQTWNGRKGDVARAILYMDVRYEGGTHGITGAVEPDLIVTDNQSLIVTTGGNASVAYMGLLSVLVQWNTEDPVDARERTHNDTVFSFQGNRNPFVDHPEWVNALFAPASDVPVAGLPRVAITRVAPNPFNPTTRVSFTLDEPAAVRIDVFAADGRFIRTLLHDDRSAGEFDVLWDGTDARGARTASGPYLLRLQSRGQVDTQKALLLK